MSYAVGPVAVPAAGRVQLPVPSESPNALGAVVIDNATPYIVTVALGGDARFLAPFTSDLFLLPATGISQAINVTAAQAPGGPANTTQSYVTATFFDTSEDLPDGYPVALAAQLIQAVLAGGFINSVDTVNNPVNTDPNGTIAVVSTSVPFPNRDAFFWPALSGETYPPNRTAGSTYSFSNIVGSPLVQAAQSAGSPGTVTWVSLPRIGYNGKTTMTFTMNAWMGALTFPLAAGTDQGYAVVGYDLNGWRSGFVWKSNGAGGPNGLSLYARMGAAADTLLVANEPLNKVRLVQIILRANGAVEWWLDGALVLAPAVGSFNWPTVFNPMAQPAWQTWVPGNSLGGMNATRISVGWT